MATNINIIVTIQNNYYNSIVSIGVYFDKICYNSVKICYNSVKICYNRHSADPVNIGVQTPR